MMSTLALVGLAALLLGACAPAAGPAPGGAATAARITRPPASIPSLAKPVATPPPAPRLAFAMVRELPPALVAGELCRLPVLTQDPSGIRGAWIAFPGGRLIPSSGAYVPPPSSADYPFGSYLVSRQAWAPVSRAAVSPDGARYAYEEEYSVPPNGFDSRIHVTDIATGRDRVVNQGSSLAVVDFEPEGVYLTRVRFHTEGSAGLWRLDPSSGALTKLDALTTYVRVRNGVAWGVVNGLHEEQLIRLDLASGDRSVWYTGPERSLGLAGLDSTGAPLLSVAGPDPANLRSLFRLAAPGQAQLVASGEGFSADFLARIQWSTDVHGTWLNGEGGVYLYASGRLTRVSTRHAVPAGVCA